MRLSQAGFHILICTRTFYCLTGTVGIAGVSITVYLASSAQEIEFVSSFPGFNS